MREFKDSITGRTKDEDEDEDDEPRQIEPPAAVSSEHRAADERITEPRA